MNSESANPRQIGDDRIYLFERFSFDAERSVLMEGERIVPLPPKTCELLGVLVENSGRLLTKAELIQTVWPDTFVEESNLTHHIAALRKALGKGNFIETVPRRGYRFVASVNDVITDSVEVEITQNRKTEIVDEIEIETDQTLSPQHQPVETGFFQKYKVALAAVGILLIVVLIGGAFFRSGRNEREEKRGLAMQRITNSNIHNSANISPDGKLISYIQNYGNGVGAVIVRQTGTNIERQLATHEKGTFGVTDFSPDSAYVFYVVNDRIRDGYSLYRVPVLGGASVLLSDKLQNGYFALSPDASKAIILRWDDEAGRSNLVIVNLDGTGSETALLSRNYNDVQLQPGGSWSPDGRHFVLPVKTAAATDNFSRSVFNLMLIDLANGSLSSFSDESWDEFGITKWQPDGSGVIAIAKKPRLRNQIFFVSYPSGKVSRVTNDSNGYSNYGLGITADGNTLVTDIWEFEARIWTMDADGDARTATRLPKGNPMFTNSGLTTLAEGQIVFATRTAGDLDLWLLSSDGSEAKPITSDKFFDAFPVASPDGKYIVFVSDRAGDGVTHLFRINHDGSGLEQLTFGAAADDTPNFSPDGNWIIYNSRSFDEQNSTWRYSIEKIPALGGDRVQVVDNCFAPSFSPDGQYFACTLPAEPFRGRIDIYNFNDGTLIRSFTVNYLYHDQLPVRWTADGKSLIFRSQENQIGNLWKQPISGGEPTKFTDFGSEIIFNFDFTRDGNHLLVSRGSVTANVVMFTNLRDTID